MSEDQKKGSLPPWLPQYVNTWHSGTNAGASARRMNPGGKIFIVPYHGSVNPFDVVPRGLIDWPDVE